MLSKEEIAKVLERLREKSPDGYSRWSINAQAADAIDQLQAEDAEAVDCINGLSELCREWAEDYQDLQAENAELRDHIRLCCEHEIKLPD